MWMLLLSNEQSCCCSMFMCQYLSNVEIYSCNYVLVHLQMLVYEFMPNGSLQDWLSGNEVFHNYKL